MEGTQGTPLKGVSNYREWTKGNVFHISFNIDGKYFMHSVRTHNADGFRTAVHKSIAEYWRQKEVVIKHNELQDKLAEAEKKKEVT